MSHDIFPEQGAYHGAVVRLENVDAFECMVGKSLEVIKVYQFFKDGDFYQDWADFIHDHGAIEFLSFDPVVETGDLNSCQVLSDDYDDIVTTFARHIRDWGHPLILSFAGEMNGHWAGWSGAHSFGPDCVTYTQVSDLYGSYGCTNTERIECADGPERYRDSYHHIHDIFASEGVTNVTWVWVANHESIPDEEWNQVDNYYPGDAYVDVISVDGYNWGHGGPGGWKTFDEVFSATLTSLSSTHPTKPFMLGEFASVEGTDRMSKASWITDAYEHIKSDWPQIKAVLWFNLSGEWDFPVQSSSENMRAYRRAIADPHFIGAPVACSRCAAIEIPLEMDDPVATAHNPLHNYTYILRTGATEPQAAVLRYGREVARIDFPADEFGELTSIGVNPTSGLTYVTQWGNDTVHSVDGTQITDSYSTGDWGPAGIWPSTSDSTTYISGKWFQSTSKVVPFVGTSHGETVSVGYNANPNAGVVAGDSQYLYLANSYSDTVSVINGGSLVDTIEVGDHPNGIAYNPANGYVYVVNRGITDTQSTVSVIDATTVVATVPLSPGYDEYLGVHPKDAITFWGNVYYGGTDIVTADPKTGYVYVANWGANSVSVISGTALLATLPVGANPNSIAYNPVTGLVYVASTGDDTVTLIEGTDIVYILPVGDYPIDLVVDSQSGQVYVVNRESDSLSIIRCEDNLPDRHVLGHYMSWYKTPQSYGDGCFNPDARGEWRMWNQCDHDPNEITGPHGFRDIAAVHYPLIGPYDSADPKVIEYHLLQALAMEVDTFVIDFYGKDDPGGIDEAALLVLEQIEEMNAQYGTDFKIALMYDGGALLDLPVSQRVGRTESDFDYMLRTYASSPAYLWADGRPVAFYFPKTKLVFSDEFDGVELDLTKWDVFGGNPIVGDGWLTLPGGATRAEIQSKDKDRFQYGALEMAIQSSDWVSHTEDTDSSIGFEIWTGANDQCHYGVILIANGHLGVFRPEPDAGGNCFGDPKYQAYVPISNWDAVRADGTIYLTLRWAPNGVTLDVNDGGSNSGQACYTGEALPDVPLKIRLNADYDETYLVDHVRVNQPTLWPSELVVVGQDFSLVSPDFPSDCFPVWTDGSYAWLKAEPWEEDGSDWGEPYLKWHYRTLDYYVTSVPTLTHGVGAVWAGFDDAGVGREWGCEGHRWIDRQGGQVYDRTWGILEHYNDHVGITYTVPVSWVQLVTLNDYMEGTTLLASVEVKGVDGVDYGYGYGHQYVQQTEDHAWEFKGLPDDSGLDIYVAQHIYNARLASGTISNTAPIRYALSAFHSGNYAEAMALADEAAGIPAPTNVTAVPACTTVRVCWEDRAEATLATGHRVYYGLAPGEYISSTVVPTDTCVTLTNLADCAYYLAVTTLGLTNTCETWYTSESWYSDEVMGRTGCIFLPVVLKSYGQ